MKAPDKLFLHPNNKGDVGASWLKFSITKEDVCYICKDTLLEKLEKAAALYKKRSDEGELVWQNMCGIKEAIDLLNSM